MTKARTFDGSKMTGAGPWAGFSFQGGCLITPEGRAIEPHHLAWLSLTANIAREWKLMMAEASQEAREKRVLQEKVVPLRRRLAQRRRLASARHVQRG